DFSCALLDARGELVVNAPHIPVHLGGLGLCVRRLREALPMQPGDVLVTNHPACGGSHLPDVTVVTPVFALGEGGAAETPGGAEALRRLAAEHGPGTIARYMESLEALAETRVREALAGVPSGRYAATECLDDGSPLSVVVAIEGDRAVIDFAGTRGVHPGNLNATPAVVRSVVMYVL